MKKLAILTTHPIQYNAPVFRLLQESRKIEPRIFYSKPIENIGYDPEFKLVIEWDIPLLEGYSHSFNPGGGKKRNLALIRAIEAFKPDAILVYGWNSPGHLAAMRYFKGRIPVLFRGDSTLLDESPGLKKWIRRIFLTFVYRHIDKALYVGSNNKKYFLKHGIREHQLHFAPHAIDNDRFVNGVNKENEEQAKNWKEQLGIQEDDFVILFAGKLQPRKDPILLLNAVKKINSRLEKPIYLLFVGSGILESKLRSMAGDMPEVKFLGFQNQSRMPIIYCLANIYCLPSSKNETWGLAVNEALACGRQVIVSDKVGCAVDLVSHEYLGQIFKAKEEAELSQAIFLLKNNFNTEKRKIQDFIRRWSFESIVTTIEEVMYT